MTTRFRLSRLVTPSFFAQHSLLVALMGVATLMAGCTGGSDSGDTRPSAFDEARQQASEAHDVSTGPSEDWLALRDRVTQYYELIQQGNMPLLFQGFASSEYKAEANEALFRDVEVSFPRDHIGAFEIQEVVVSEDGTRGTTYVQIWSEKTLGMMVTLDILNDRIDHWEKEDGEWRIVFDREKFIVEMSGVTINLLERHGQRAEPMQAMPQLPANLGGGQ